MATTTTQPARDIRPVPAGAEVLTRHDAATGQRLYDYYLAETWDDPDGGFLRPQPGGGFRSYALREVRVRVYQVI